MLVGEEHANPSMARTLQLLLRAAPADCVFLEYPSDLQPALDRAYATDDMVVFQRAFRGQAMEVWYDVMDELGLREMARRQRALRDGYTEAQWRADVTSSGVVGESQAFLSFARARRVRLLTYDTATDSALYRAQAMASTLMERRGGSVGEVVRQLERRNVVMAENIGAAFTRERCQRAMVLVGDAHLANLPRMLRERGLATNVLRVAQGAQAGLQFQAPATLLTGSSVSP